jgi:type IV pilus assembly protein PilV
MVDKPGFTLLEVLIAISIFAVGVLAVATLQVTAIRGNRLGNEVTQATSLAQMQIEALKSADINSAALAPGHYDDPNNPIDETGAHGGTFTRSWDIAENTAFSRTVTVTVRWIKGGSSRLVTLSTVTRGGGN